jgi:hypothetical protein
VGVWDFSRQPSQPIRGARQHDDVVAAGSETSCDGRTSSRSNASNNRDAHPFGPLIAASTSRSLSLPKKI